MRLWVSLTELMCLWLVLTRSISGVSDPRLKLPFRRSASSLYFFCEDTENHNVMATLADNVPSQREQLEERPLVSAAC